MDRPGNFPSLQRFLPEGALSPKQKRLALLGVGGLAATLLFFGGSPKQPALAPHMQANKHADQPVGIQQVRDLSQEIDAENQALAAAQKQAAAARRNIAATQKQPQTLEELARQAGYADTTQRLGGQAAPEQRQPPKAIVFDHRKDTNAERYETARPVSKTISALSETNGHRIATAAAPDPKPATYTLPEGTVISTVLTNRLDGEMAGPVNCMVTADVFDPVTQALLIPQGARILGEASKVSAFGEQRLAIAFHKIQIQGPGGIYSIPLDHAPAMDAGGDVGLGGKVNHHYLSIFGASMALGAIGGLAQIGNGGSVLVYSPGMEMRNGFTESMAQSSNLVLNRFLDRMPTIAVKPGTPVDVYLTSDVPNVPPYIQSMRLGPSSDQIARREP